MNARLAAVATKPFVLLNGSGLPVLAASDGQTSSASGHREGAPDGYKPHRVPEPPTLAAGTLGVASPPSVAAEAPPQVVSNGADVGDAPQYADAIVQTYGGVDLADTVDIDDYFADVIPASSSAPPPVIAGAVPKAPPPFIDIRINRAALANAIGHTTSIKTCRVFYFCVLRRCTYVRT